MNQAQAEHRKDEADQHRQDVVTISVNGKPVEIHRGRREVSEIKAKGEVPAADTLAQVVSGELKPLPDDGSIVIRGEEVFLSYPKDAAASYRPSGQR